MGLRDYGTTGLLTTDDTDFTDGARLARKGAAEDRRDYPRNWLPKPATRQAPQARDSLREKWSRNTRKWPDKATLKRRQKEE
jgi:hypothetical protein